MAASKAAAFSSRISPSLRHLLLTRSTAIASTAAFSLTGKLPTTNSPATTSPTHTQKLNLREVIWPAFPHQKVVIEAASKTVRKVDSDDDEESDEEFYGEVDSVPDFCEDDLSDEDEFDDDDEETDDDDQGKGRK